MKKSRENLTLEERQYLYKLRADGKGIREIGRRIDRPGSTISRELKRNRPGSPFFGGLSPLERAKHAHDKAKKRKRGQRQRQRLKCYEIRVYVEEKLSGEKDKPETRWTPELIAGRLQLDRPGLRISHEAVYQWIYKERRDLLKYLPVAGKEKRRKRSKQRKNRARQQPAAPKRSIETRPDKVEERQQVGHWEGDTIVSRQSKACLQNLTERTSRYLKLTKLQDCTAQSATQAAISRLSNIPPGIRETITFDNGPENSGHELLDRELGTETYFCHPYCASERGTVENRNGFVRRFFPKKTDFAKISVEQVEAIEKAHNCRPMKCLRFRTPHEVFIEAFKEACNA